VSHGWFRNLPGMLGNWTRVRDLRELPQQTFRAWWKERAKNGGPVEASVPLRSARKIAQDAGHD
jgi:hypothetical protein